MSEFRSEMERAVWRRIEAKAEFHWSDLVLAGCPKSTAETFVRRWEKAGRIRQVRKDGHRKIFVNAALQADAVPDAAMARTVEDALWTVMRRLKVFTPTDVAAHANASEHAVTVDKVRSYCRKLLGAGYVRVRQTAIPGAREAAYQLTQDTGPRAPRPARVVGLIDPNTEEFHPAPGAVS